MLWPVAQFASADAKVESGWLDDCGTTNLANPDGVLVGSVTDILPLAAS